MKKCLLSSIFFLFVANVVNAQFSFTTQCESTADIDPAKRSVFTVKARGESAEAAKINAYNEVLAQMDNKLIEMRNVHRAWDNDIRFARKIMGNIKRLAQTVYNSPSNFSDAKSQIAANVAKWQGYKIAEVQKAYTCDGKRYSEDAMELRSKIERTINDITTSDEQTQVYEDDFFITGQVCEKIAVENNKFGKSADVTKEAAKKILEYVWQWEKVLSDIAKE